MFNKLASLLKISMPIVIGMMIANVHAEYYMVYSSSEPSPCVSCCNHPHYQHRYHKIRHHKYYHRPVYHRRSSYSIRVYYYNACYPYDCRSGCGACRPVCHSCNPCHRVSRCCNGTNDFVTFSGDPAWGRDPCFYGDESPYYQDQRTADDVYPDMNIDN